MQSKEEQLKKKGIKTYLDRNYLHNFVGGRRFGLYGESYFLEMLHLERKRAERSPRPFCLMLLDLEKFTDADERRQISKKVAYHTNTITRETDIKGWYKNGAVIGIIFTETVRSEAERIRSKVRQSLGKVLRMEELNDIVITISAFPEEAAGDESGNLPDMTLYPELSEHNHRKVSLALKRVIDLGGSIFGLFIFAPFFVVVPVLIKLTSEGPVFFRQERLGQYGKKFTFLKFRTMHVNNDPSIHKEFVKNLINGRNDRRSNSGEGRETVYKIKDDPRVTPLGRILRKTSLDELPQFINALKGDLSLVGPRPPIPYEFENYNVWHRRRVIEIKPGITGLWQVMGRSSTNFDDMVRLDIKYKKEWSLWLDLKIIMQTPWAVIFGRGAY